MTIQDLIRFIGGLLNDVVLPVITTLAFLFFIWNAFRYFILGGANPDDQAKAKTLAIWGVLAFVVMSSLWGIVNILVVTFGFGAGSPVSSDYMCSKSWTGCDNGDPNRNAF